MDKDVTAVAAPLERRVRPHSPTRDIVSLLRNLERQSEDNIWRTAQEAREEIERLREHAVILAATAEQVERERCAKLLRDMWNEREASHGNRAGPYHDGWTAALDIAERRLLGLGA